MGNNIPRPPFPGPEPAPPPEEPEPEPQPKPPNKPPPSDSKPKPPKPNPQPPGGSEPAPGNGEDNESGSESSEDKNRPPKPAGPSHPLNQLDQSEIRKAVKIIKDYAITHRVQQDLIFASVSMKEPRKRDMIPYLFDNGPKPPRRAWAVVSPAGQNLAYDIVVNLDRGEVEDIQALPEGTQPSFNADDPFIIQDIVRKDPNVIDRARRAGVTNMEYLTVDLWSYGYNGTEEDKKHLRLADVYLYKRNDENDNQYAHPLDFLVTVNLISKEVESITDLPVCPGNEPTAEERPIPPPEAPQNYDPRELPKDFFRKDVKPLEIRQKDGPSFKIDGNTINWQNWEMIIGFNFREGLTLHNITFNDHGEKRPVLYRAALSEMVVPYGDPRIPYYRKSAFDLGEYGLGYNANPLSNGCDCLGEIRYMDFVFANSKGEPEVTRNAICIHEEDSGLLQKHTEFRNGRVTLARSRKLVISFLATVTNYDYLFYWNFFQDGTMEVDIKATGLLSVHSLGLGENCGPGGFGVITAPRINAPYHQHIFCVRLDTMIDGPNNTVAIQEVVPLEEPFGSEGNPFGQGFITRYTILEDASESGTDTDPDSVRSWIVANENKLNPNTRNPVGWKLVTPGFAKILAGSQSGIYKRAGFATHNVWVTPYDDDQLYAAGKFINQAEGDRDGLQVWAERGGDIRNTDIVLWHTFGLTHIPRVEDYPLMPVEGTSFIFRPSNFFSANPALDVPPPKKKTCGK